MHFAATIAENVQKSMQSHALSLEYWKISLRTFGFSPFHRANHCRKQEAR